MKKVILTTIAAVCCVVYSSAVNPFAEMPVKESTCTILLAESNSIPIAYQGTYYAEDPRDNVSVGSTQVVSQSMGTRTIYKVYGYSSRDNHATLVERVGGTLSPQYGDTLISLSFFNDGTIYLDGKKYTKR